RGCPVLMLPKNCLATHPSRHSFMAFAQFIAVCRRSKWSKHLTNCPFLALLAMMGSNAQEVVSLQPAGKYQRPAWRPSQGHKGIDERALIASPQPSPPRDVLKAGRADTQPRGHLQQPVAPSLALSASRLRWLWPRRHAKEQHFAHAPDMVRQSRRHG